VLTTTPAAVVEPKKKSQGPGAKAKAKRIKRLLANPDFAEAVSEERVVAQLWEDAHGVVDEKFHALIKEYRACLDEREDTVELKNGYIELLEGSKVLVDAIQGHKGVIATHSLRRSRR
jgi:hypothetical protein